MPVITIALCRNPAGFTNRVLECGDALLLRRGRTGHVRDLLFHDGAVQVINAVTERDLREWQTQTDPVRRDVPDIVEIDPTYRKIAKLLDGRSTFEMSEHRRLRFEGKRDKTTESASFVLKLSK